MKSLIQGVEVSDISVIRESLTAVSEQHHIYDQEIKNVVKSLQTDTASELATLATDLKISRENCSKALNDFVVQLNALMHREIASVGNLEKQGVFLNIGFSILGTLLALLVAGIALLILNPIRDLIRSTKIISSGDYSHRLIVKSSDEVGMLAKEFNTMAESIEVRNRELEKLSNREKLALIGELSSQITHEIKNPLHSLGLNLEALREDLHGKVSDDTQELLGSIEEEVQRINRVAHHYLQFTKSNNGQKNLVQINDLLEDVLFFMRGELEHKKIKLNQVFSPNMPKVEVDQDQFKQAIMNILKNAIEAVPQSGGQVNVVTEFTSDGVTITVEDNGPGIVAENMDKVFNTFFTTKSHGTGLGLPLTQKIVEEQGGQISCHSSTIGGTGFRFRFPISTEVHS